MEKEDVVAMKERLEEVQLEESKNRWSDHCIFRVPTNLREVGVKAYTPQIVSLGPYHRGGTYLHHMDKHKLRFLRQFLNRNNGDLEHCLRIIHRLEDRIRACYEEPITDEIDHGNGDFVQMMLLDACFIIELFRASWKGWDVESLGYNKNDPIFSTRSAMPCIQRDMLMLENQIPWFVLQALYTVEPERDVSLFILALHFFNSHVQASEEQNGGGSNYLHLLDIVRRSLVPSHDASAASLPLRSIVDGHQPKIMAHSVTELMDYGIHFKRSESKRLMHIEFERNYMKIPQLVITDSTKSILLNFMAFEQCYLQCSGEVTAYVNFMDGLIGDSRDSSYLTAEQIIVHRLGSEEAVGRFFNNLCREMTFDIDQSHLSNISIQVQDYMNKKTHKWWVSLKHEYRRHPWAIASIAAAFLLLTKR